MQINTVGIIGGGTMGSGIAIVTAKANLHTILIEKTQVLADAALAHITREIDTQIARWGMTVSEKKFILSKLQIGADLNLVQEADLVISAVPDDLELKKQIFSHLNTICKAETIFSNDNWSLERDRTGYGARPS